MPALLSFTLCLDGEKSDGKIEGGNSRKENFQK